MADGVVISTGQQAALFGGPLYTLVKALSALAFADVLERDTGIPVAPVFWAATDDADFEEASSATSSRYRRRSAAFAAALQRRAVRASR